MMSKTYVVDPQQQGISHLSALNPCLLTSNSEVENAFSQDQQVLWITWGMEACDWVTKNAYVHPQRDQLLAWLDREFFPCSSGIQETIFQHSVLIPPTQDETAGMISFLPPEEIAEVLMDKNACDFCIGGFVLPNLELVKLFRGDLSSILIPLATFTDNPRGAALDIRDFEVIDFGQSLRFGEYEAAFGAVLYEVDSDYRKRIHSQRLAEDKSFGAALRRLRKQKGLKRSDFPGLNEKTIARIERGEVNAPQQETLDSLGKALGVDPGTIQDY